VENLGPDFRVPRSPRWYNRVAFAKSGCFCQKEAEKGSAASPLERCRARLLFLCRVWVEAARVALAGYRVKVISLCRVWGEAALSITG
jgi:hypothetical protein